MEEELKGLICSSCKVVGKHLDGHGKSTFGPMSIGRNNALSIKRQGVSYHADITVIANRKEIVVSSDQESTLGKMYGFIMDIVWFENLFEGCFFPFVSWKVDGEEYIEKLNKYFLAYINSSRHYMWIPLNYEDREYKRLFNKWCKVLKSSRMRHQVFLYSTFAPGMTGDIRMALLLQIFEPIADELHAEQKIILVKQPHITHQALCQKCGAIVNQTVKNKNLFLSDRLDAILKQYGKEVFKGDSKRKVIKKAVNVRNRVFHVDGEKNNAMTGKQCGFYLYKFSLLYRVILFTELGIGNAEMKEAIKKWVKDFNSTYPPCRILP